MFTLSAIIASIHIFIPFLGGSTKSECIKSPRRFSKLMNTEYRLLFLIFKALVTTTAQARPNDLARLDLNKTSTQRHELRQFEFEHNFPSKMLYLVLYPFQSDTSHNGNIIQIMYIVCFKAVKTSTHSKNCSNLRKIR